MDEFRVETPNLNNPNSDLNILKELDTMVESGIYFEGWPFVDFSNKKPNWEQISKGILSPSNL
jgi:hypothetical protein